MFSCDRVIIIKEGRVEHKGEPEVLQHQLLELKASKKRKIPTTKVRQNEMEEMVQDQKKLHPQGQGSDSKFEVKKETYFQYFSYHPLNYLFFPLAILIGAGCEFLANYFFMVSSGYDKVETEDSNFENYS